tara:strand:- start:129 stop:431 length:303 start_codon:yes stop_codon:yes gene_type:complete
MMDLRKHKDTHHPNYNEPAFHHIFNPRGSHKANKHYPGEVRQRWMTATGMPKPDDYELIRFHYKLITDELNNGAHCLTLAYYCDTSQKLLEDTYSGLVVS